MSRAAPQPPEDALDQWLVLRAQAGDEHALRRLYDRWAKRLQRHALRMTNDRDAAADASQEAWLGIVRGLHRLNDPACFRRWAYQIVGRKCADWVRRQQRRRATVEPMTNEPTAPDETADTPDRQQAVRQTLTRLSSQDRVVLAMHYAEGMPLSEIADSLGVPRGTVKSRLFHARRRLKEAIERDERISNPRETQR